MTVMDRQDGTASSSVSDGDGTNDESIASYLAALERGDAADAPAPAAALAELLAARLEGTEAPEAREVLESLAPVDDQPRGEGPP